MEGVKTGEFRALHDKIEIQILDEGSHRIARDFASRDPKRPSSDPMPRPCPPGSDQPRSLSGPRRRFEVSGTVAVRGDSKFSTAELVNVGPRTGAGPFARSP